MLAVSSSFSIVLGAGWNYIVLLLLRPTFVVAGGLPRPSVSTAQELEGFISTLHANAGKWASTPITHKAKLFKQCVSASLGTMDTIAELDAKAKGLYNEPPNSHG